MSTTTEILPQAIPCVASSNSSRLPNSIPQLFNLLLEATVQKTHQLQRAIIPSVFSSVPYFGLISFSAVTLIQVVGGNEGFDGMNPDLFDKVVCAMNCVAAGCKAPLLFGIVVNDNGEFQKLRMNNSECDYLERPCVQSCMFNTEL